MKTFLHITSTLFLLTLLLTTGCKRVEKALYSGDYDFVINKSINKLKANKKKDKYIFLLEEAYQKANKTDIDEIKYLEKEAQANNWITIYQIYKRLYYRQRKVERLLPLYISSEHRRSQIEIRDYTQALADSKAKAAGYLYEQASNLLLTKNKYDARKAYSILCDLKRLYENYELTNEKLKEARLVGTNHVLVRLRNGSVNLLPVQFQEQLRNMNLAHLNETWTIYHTIEDKAVQYDYDVVMNVLAVDFGPERITEKQYLKEREIQDGWTYLRDECNQYVVDSLGKKVKTPVYKVVQCEVLETTQSRTATITANVDYFRRANQQLLKSYPIVGSTLFENQFVEFNGNLLALDKDFVLAGQNTQPVPFPRDEELLAATYQELNNSLRRVLRTGTSLIP